MGTSTGLCIRAKLRAWDFGPAHGKAEQMFTSPAVILVLSMYNAALEEAMFRGVIMNALVHATVPEAPLPTLSASFCGPCIGSVAVVVLCNRLGLFAQFRSQCSHKTWNSQTGFDAGLGTVVVMGGLMALYMHCFGGTPLSSQQVLATLIQAFVFAELHRLGGLPPGQHGFAMLFVWAAALGFLRLQAGGMLLVFLAHVCGDVTIGMLILFVRRLNLRKCRVQPSI